MLPASLSHLEKHDIPMGVLDVLRQSRVRHVSIIGRRGPREAAFTTRELREMMTLPNASMVPLDKQLMEEALDKSEGSGNGPMTRQQKRLLDLLKKGGKNVFGESDLEKTWSLEFFRSPSGVAPSASGNGMDLTLAHTALEPPQLSASGSTANRRAIPTGHTSTVTLRTDLIYTSLGYSSASTDAWFDHSLGHIRNTGGRVIDEEGRLVRGLYSSGWAAGGGKGILASMMLDAHAEVDTILSNLRTQDPQALPPSQPNSVQVQTTPIQPLPLLSSFPSSPTADDVVLLNPEADCESVPAEVLDGVMAGNVMDYASWKRVDAE